MTLSLAAEFANPGRRGGGPRPPQPPRDYAALYRAMTVIGPVIAIRSGTLALVPTPGAWDGATAFLGVAGGILTGLAGVYAQVVKIRDNSEARDRTIREHAETIGRLNAEVTDLKLRALAHLPPATPGPRP